MVSKNLTGGVHNIDPSGYTVFIRAYWQRNNNFEHETFYCGWHTAQRNTHCLSQHLQ